MNNVSLKKLWGMDTNPSHLEPLPIPLIKETSTGNSDGDSVKIKFYRDLTSSTSDIYEFRMSLFDHGEPEEFLLFARNFKMIIAASVKIETLEKVQYLLTLVRGEALRQFELVSADAKNTETLLDVDYLLQGLACFFFP